MSLMGLRTEKPDNYIFKLMLLGGRSVGKSRIFSRFTGARLYDLGTIVADSQIKTIELEGEKITLQIWDTAGFHRFRPMVATFMRGTMGVILVYDITTEESYTRISSDLQDIEKYANKDVEKIIVGNKCEMEDGRAVSKDRASRFAQERGIPFLEVSAIDDINVDETFYTLAQNILKKKLQKNLSNLETEKSFFGKLRGYFSRTGRRKEEKGNDVIYNDAYFRALEAGETKNTRIPVMIVGQDRAGKTSLKKHLLGLPFNADEPSTTGIGVDVVEITDKNAEEPWRRKEEKQFFTSANEAEHQVLKQTARLVMQRRHDSNNEEHNTNDEGGVARSRKQDQPHFETKQAKTLPPKAVDKIKFLTKKIHKKESSAIEVFVHDLAGQSIFFDTHFCFLKMHCPYVLVLDLKTPLEEPAQPRFKFQSIDAERHLNNPFIATNLDHFLSWLTVLARLRDSESDMFLGEFPNFQLPPVLIALTNSDKFKGDVSKVKERIKAILAEKGFENVFTEPYIIDNTLKDRANNEIRKLRRKLYSLCTAILEKQRPMPVRWLQFEGALSNKMMVEGLMHIPIDEARAVAESCNVREIDASIKFLHHQGIVVHHSESPVVVLNPPWLMNLFTEVITVPQEEIPSDAPNYKLLRKGILMQDYLEKRVNGKLLEELMKQFSLICPWKYEGKPAFIVPSVAPLMEKGEDVQKQLFESPIASIFIEFSCWYVPLGFLTRFLVYLINLCRKDLLSEVPQLYCNYSLLSFSRSEGQFDVYLVKIPAKIKVGVVPRATPGQKSHSMFVSYLMQVLGICMQSIKDEEPLVYRNVTVSVTVKCSVCWGERQGCLKHGKARCDRDECGHFWSLDELQGCTEDPVCEIGSDVRTRKFPLEDVRTWLNNERTESFGTARVISNYEGAKDGELSVNKDDTVVILKKDVELGWSRATVNGKVGLLPDNCFKLLPAEEVKSGKEESNIYPEEAETAARRTGPCAQESSINDLDLLVRQGVCKKLDIMDDVGGDFRTLAAHFGMPSDELDLISQGGNGTHRVLRWAGRNPENTIAKLRQILLDMERSDCVKIIDESPTSRTKSSSNR